MRYIHSHPLLGMEELVLNNAVMQLDRLHALKHRLETSPANAAAIFHHPSTRAGLEAVGIDHQEIALESITAGLVTAVGAAIAAVVAVIWKIVSMVRGKKKGDLPDDLTPSTISAVTSIAAGASEDTIKNMAENAEKVMEASEESSKSSKDADFSDNQKQQLTKYVSWLTSYEKLIPDRKARMERYGKELPKFEEFLKQTNAFITGLIDSIKSNNNTVTDDLLEDVNGQIRKMRASYPDFAGKENDEFVTPTDTEDHGLEVNGQLAHEVKALRHLSFGFTSGVLTDHLVAIAEALEAIYQMSPDGKDKLSGFKAELSKTMGAVGRYLYRIKQVRVEVLHAMMARTIVNTIWSNEAGSNHANKATQNHYEQMKKDAQSDLEKDEAASKDVEKRLARLKFK